MSGSKRPAQGDWYSPYFAPTTVLAAVSVLFLSIEAGKYTGAYLIQRDKPAQPVITAPISAHTATKAAAHATPPRSHAATTGKSHH